MLTILTGGLVLRFNPSIPLQRESIEFYLNYFNCTNQEEKYLIATLGSSLFSANSLIKNDGHSFSLSDIIKVNNTLLLKVRNSQTKLKLKVKLSEK